MLLLDTTTRKLQVTTSAATNVDAVAAWVDLTTSGYAPGVTPTAITTATTTDIVAAPASSTTRQVKTLSVRNKSTTTANTVSVLLDDSGTDYVMHVARLAPGDTLRYTDTDGWRVHDSVGRPINASAESAPIDGYSRTVFKVGAASEAAGLLHTLALSAGSPGAWAPGTPGMGGRATDGTASADAGCIQLQTPASGSNYLVGYAATGTVAHAQVLIDVLWVQSGITVTTTTAQTVTSVAWPARDNDGATAGKGVQVGILVSAATGNAGAITNTTLTYTASDGTGSRTGTIASFPATAAIGTIIPFALAGGDLGVQSVQSVTLGTTYTSGTIHLIAYRLIAQAPATLANVGGAAALGKGPKLWAGSCLLPAYFATATSATTLTGTATVEVR
jgi:hypothetical protein